jgi:AraC family transcriptional regulator
MEERMDLQRKFERALLIAGLREDYSDSNSGIPAQWQRFAPHIGKLPQQIGNVAYGIVFGKTAGFSYLTGVEVSDTASLPAGSAQIRIPAQSYLVFSHKGHVSTLFESINAALAFVYPNGHPAGEPGEMGFYERYGETFDPVKGSGDIEIWIPIRP